MSSKWLRGLVVFFVGGLLVSCAEHVQAAGFVLTTSDSNNATSTSFNGNAQGHWSSGAAPAPGNTYSTAAFAIRSPNNATSYTFAGDSLTIAGGGGRFLMKGTGTTLATSQTCTVNLFLGGGYADEANASDGAIETLAGTITLTTTGALGALSVETLIVNSPISGNFPLHINGGLDTNSSETGTVILSGSNSSTSSLTDFAGILEFAATNSMPSGAVSINTGATLAVALGGAGQFTTGTSGVGSLSATISGTGSQGGPVNWSAGTVLGIDTSSASATYAGAITNTTGGSLGLIKLGGNTLTLSGSNTYTGSTTVQSGTLLIAGPNSLPAGTLTVSGGTLDAGGQTFGAAAVTLNSGAIIDGTLNATGYSVVTGSIAANLGGSTAALTKSNSATTVTLSGNNTYGGTTTISGGTLQLASNSAVGTGNLIFNNTGAANSVINIVGAYSQTVASLSMIGSNTDSIIGSSGSLAVNGGSVQFGSDSKTSVINLSGLGSFTQSSTAAPFIVGVQTYSASTCNVTVNMAASNLITASSATIGTQCNSGTPSVVTFNMGQSNVFATGAFSVGQARTTTLLQFASGLTNPTVTISGSSGSTSRTPFLISLTGQGNNIATSGTADFNGGTVSALVSTLAVGQVAANTPTGVTGVFRMGNGSVDAQTIEVAQIISPATGGVVTGTFTMNGPNSLVVANTINISDNAAAGGNATGTFNLNGGTLLAGTIQHGGGFGSAIFNWNSGAIGSYNSVTGGTGNLTIGNNLTLAMAATGVQTFAVPAGQIGTVNATLVDGTPGANLNVTGGGTLILTAANSYSGQTSVNGGALTLSGFGQINSSSGITVNGPTAKFVQNSTVAVNPNVTLTQGSVDGTGMINSVAVANTPAAIVNNGAGSTTPLAIGSLNFNGAATVNVNTAGAAGLIVNGALVTTPSAGQVTINVTTAPVWVNGNTYNLIGYGSFSGNVTDFTKGTIPGLGARQSASLGDTGNSNGFITLAIAGDSPYWTGQASGLWSTTAVGSPYNWKLLSGQTGTEFLPNDQVLFDDNATGTTNVSITSGNVNPLSVTFSNNNLNYSVSGSNGIVDSTNGATTLAVNGNGRVTISTSNSYSGGTTVSSGTLQVGNAAALGTGSVAANGGVLDLGGFSPLVTSFSGASGTITNSGTSTSVLTVSQTTATVFSGVLIDGPTGQVALAKAGSGMLTLVSSNGYSGGTTISGGVLNINDDTSLGQQSGALAFTGNGGTLQFANAITVNRNINLSSGVGAFDTQTLVSPTTIAGTISGSGGLAKFGSSVLALTASNTYTGGTTISGGVLNINDDTSLGQQSGALAFTGNGGTLQFANAITVSRNINLSSGVGAFDTQTLFSPTTIAGTISGSGGLANVGSSLLVLTASNTYTGPTTVSAGSLQIGNGGSGEFLASPTVNVASGATLTFAHSDALTYAGTISGNGAVTELGPGILTLSGSANFSGATTISSGTANMSGSSLLVGAIGGNGTLIVSGSVSTNDGASGVASTVSNVLLTNGGQLQQFGDLGTTSSAGTLTITGGSLVQRLFTRSIYDSTFVQGGFQIGQPGNSNGFVFQGGQGQVFDLGGGSPTITFNGGTSPGTIASTIQNGTFVKAGSGTIVLTGTNTYTGGTFINGGILNVNSDAALGPDSGALNFPTATGTFQFSVPFTLPASRTVNTTATATFDTQTLTGVSTIASVISGSGAFTKTGSASPANPSPLLLSGSNTFTGNVTINVGNLIINNSLALGSGTKTITITNGTAGNPQLHLDPGPGGSIVLPASFGFLTSNTAPVLITDPTQGTVVNDSGNNVINGSFNLTSGGGGTVLTVNSGSLTFTGNFTPSTSGRILDLRGNGTGAISGLIVNGSTTNMPLYLDSGSGTWTLSGANTYSGPTSINYGTLNATILNAGSTPSSIGASTNAAANVVIGGGTLLYTGTGAMTDRLFTINPAGAIINASAANSAALTFSNTGANVSADAASLNVTQSATNPNQLSVIPAIGATDALAVGMGVSGPGIPSGAMITAIAPYTITLDQAASISGTANISFSPVNRTLTLTGSSSGANSLASALADSVGGGKLSVLKNGLGVWQLAGSNSYSGGTSVTDGTLIATNPAAIPDNSSLYVGSASTVFAPVVSSAPVSAASAAEVAAVPEPGTIALAAAAAALLLLRLRQR